MKNTALYYLSSYITALRSTKVDGKLFADLPTQQAFFRKKALESIPSDLINWSEVTRQAGMDRTRWQDIRRGKVKATADDLQAVHDVLAKHFA